MIKYLIAGVVVAALVGRAGAEPDDKHLNVGVARAPAYKAPVYKAPVYKAPVYKESADGWSGFYGGLSLGARWANNDWRTSDIFPTFVGVVQTAGDHGAINSVAARMGAYAGYNWQFDPAWIAGIEIDFGWANNRKSASPMPGSPVCASRLARDNCFADKFGAGDLGWKRAWASWKADHARYFAFRNRRPCNSACQSLSKLWHVCAYADERPVVCRCARRNPFQNHDGLDGGRRRGTETVGQLACAHRLSLRRLRNI